VTTKSRSCQRVSGRMRRKRVGFIEADVGWLRLIWCCPEAACSSPWKDVGNYITKLPKAEHAVPKWWAAMEALILAATHTMLARIVAIAGVKVLRNLPYWVDGRRQP
jgi:hypothetical protein